MHGATRMKLKRYVCKTQMLPRRAKVTFDIISKKKKTTDVFNLTFKTDLLSIGLILG